MLCFYFRFPPFCDLEGSVVLDRWIFGSSSHFWKFDDTSLPISMAVYLAGSDGGFFVFIFLKLTLVKKQSVEDKIIHVTFRFGKKRFCFPELLF